MLIPTNTAMTAMMTEIPLIRKTSSIFVTEIPLIRKSSSIFVTEISILLDEASKANYNYDRNTTMTEIRLFRICPIIPNICQGFSVQKNWTKGRPPCAQVNRKSWEDIRRMTKKMAQNCEKMRAKLNVLKFILVL
jgi:hypothetical protein